MLKTIKIKTQAQFWKWAVEYARTGPTTLWKLYTTLDPNGHVALKTGEYRYTFIDMPSSLGKELRKGWTKDRWGRPNYAKTIVGIVKILDPEDKHGVVKAHRDAKRLKKEQSERFKIVHAVGVVRTAATALSEALMRYKDLTGLDETTPLAEILKRTEETKDVKRQD